MEDCAVLMSEAVEHPSKPARPTRLRRIGLVILLAGFACAGAVRWLGKRAEPVPVDDSSVQISADDSKVIVRNNQLLYGKPAVALMGLLDDLKSPSGIAVLIVVATVCGAFACFHLARVAEERS